MRLFQYPGAKLAIALGLGLLQMGLLAPNASAHGDWQPRHGGRVNNGGETTFEVVFCSGRVLVYVSDHGDPVPTAGAKATIEVVRNGEVVTAELRPAGGDKLEGRIDLTPSRDDSMVVRAVMSNGSVALGRFSAKN